MSRKEIIQVSIVVVCFGVAALVLYNGLFKKTSVSSQSGINSSEVASKTGMEENPLPYGDNLEGELKRVLKKNNLQYNTVVYPKLDPSQVGISTSDLIKPLPAVEETQ